MNRRSFLSRAAAALVAATMPLTLRKPHVEPEYVWNHACPWTFKETPCFDANDLIEPHDMNRQCREHGLYEDNFDAFCIDADIEYWGIKS